LKIEGRGRLRKKKFVSIFRGEKVFSSLDEILLIGYNWI